MHEFKIKNGRRVLKKDLIITTIPVKPCINTSVYIIRLVLIYVMLGIQGIVIKPIRTGIRGNSIRVGIVGMIDIISNVSIVVKVAIVVRCGKLDLQYATPYSTPLYSYHYYYPFVGGCRVNT